MSEFNLKKYISNNPLITEGKEEKVDEVVNEELDLVHVYDKNNKKIIGTGRVVQSEKPNPYSVIVQFDRDLILSFPRDRVKPVKEEVEVNEGLMDDIFGGIPYKTVGVVSFTTVELPDSTVLA